jgi:hypothetical protein
MRVKALFFADGRYRIDVMVDADHLPSEINPFPSVVEEPQVSPAVAARVRDFRARFVREVRVAFDGAADRPAEEAVSDAEAVILAGPATSRKLFFRLVGTVPSGAKTFTWSHGLPVGSYLFGAQEENDTDVAWHWLEGGGAVATLSFRRAPSPVTRLDVIRTYLVLGFTHILPHGADHILFVLGLFFLSLDFRTILKQVTAFTIAHSITLGLTIYGFVSLSPRIVEPLIALSIVYVAVENLVLTEVKPWRLAIVFCFGLLHGMGFAGVLSELGLPRSEFLTALVAFNVGVEGGQLAVIALAFLALGLWFGDKRWYRRRIAVPASALISLVGAYWTVERFFL